MSRTLLLIAGGIAVITLAASVPLQSPHHHTTGPVTTEISGEDNQMKPIAPFLQKGIDWLADAQLPNGGWGAGQHSMQQNRDPHSVQVDPATTAFAAMALLRSGSTPDSGPYAAHVKGALSVLLQMIENAPNGNNITNITGTQPQSKLGQNIDVSMASQFLTKVKPLTKDNVLAKRIDNAIAICVRKLEKGQNADGSYMAGGWAPVLQSAMATNALESANSSGYVVDNDKLRQAKAYQRTNVDAASGAAKGEDAAGISLYALASTQRASVNEARRVREIVKEDKAIELEKVGANELEEYLQKKGVNKEEAEVLADAYVVNRAASNRLNDDSVLSGFGNNGGEEFLSYMMTSESMVQTGDKEWTQWHSRMTNLLSSVQNPNGSWSGHHCITSPVFCTAAVVLTMTADRSAVLAVSHK